MPAPLQEEFLEELKQAVRELPAPVFFRHIGNPESQGVCTVCLVESKALVELAWKELSDPKNHPTDCAWRKLKEMVE